MGVPFLPVSAPYGAHRLDPAALMPLKPGGFDGCPVLTLNAQPPNEALIIADATWTQIGTTSVPLILVERQLGSSLQFIRFDNLRFEFDPARLDIPALCTTAQAPTAAPPTPEELFSQARWQQIRKMLPYRRLFPEDK